MEYFNSEEGLKLWDEAMAEGEEEEQEEERHDAKIEFPTKAINKRNITIWW